MGRLNFEFNMPLQGSGSGASINVGTITFFPINVRDSISFNTLNLVAVHNGAGSLTLSVGLYSLNVSTLSLANSASGSVSGANVANRWAWISLATSATQDITPGTWYFALLATTSNLAWSLWGQQTMAAGNPFPGGFIGGAMTVSTGALPASIATSDLDITGSDAMTTPFIIISA